MPTMIRVKFEKLVTDFGWVLKAEHAGLLQYLHPEFPHDVLSVNTVCKMGCIVRKGKSRLDFMGLSGAKATLKSFHQVELPLKIKPQIRKAMRVEQEAYSNESHVYPLYGFVTFAGQTMAIEQLGSGDEYKYEVMVPKGMIFVPDGVHTLLCKNLADVRERVSDNDLELEKCEEQPTMEDVNALSEFKVVSHDNYWVVEAVATHPEDTSRVASVTIANCSSPEMAEMVKQAVSGFKRLSLALTYLEDGAPNSALRALKGGR
jgi:hypothetical protein